MNILIKIKQIAKKRWFPMMLFIVLLAVVSFMWSKFEENEFNVTKKSLIIEAENVSESISFDLEKRLNSLKRVVNRWEESQGTPKKQFINDIESYIKDDPGYQAIEWVDRSLHVRWIVPYEGNEAAQDLNLALELNRRTALELSIKTKNPIISSPIDLVQGGKGLLVYHPIYVENDFDGFILAVFRLSTWLSQLTKDDRIYLNIKIDDIVALSSEGWNKKAVSKWDIQYESNIYNHRFIVSLKPKDIYLSENNTPLPEVFLIIGTIFSILISFVVYLIQKTHESLKITKNSKLVLVKEVNIRKHTENLLIKERERLAYILEGTNVGTWEWNVQTGETIFNERWANIIGYTLDELSPISIETWEKYSHPEDLKESENLLNKHFNKELDYYELEARMKHKNGQWIWILDRGQVSTWTEEGTPLLMAGTHEDITARKKIEDEIKHLATHDKLTNLPTLSLTKDRLLMALEVAKRENHLVAVLFADLDGFKAINDQYGHDAGDFVLKEVSKRLKRTIRNVDTVGRIGGDEFIIILSGFHSVENISVISKNIISNVSAEIIFNDIKMCVGISIGISIYPNNSKELKELIKFADNAMYEVKNRGKNNYTFYKK